MNILATTIKQEKEIIVTRVRKGNIKLSVFRDIIIHLWIPGNCTEKNVEIIAEFSKVDGYKLNRKVKYISILQQNKPRKHN